MRNKSKKLQKESPIKALSLANDFCSYILDTIPNITPSKEKYLKNRSTKKLIDQLVSDVHKFYRYLLYADNVNDYSKTIEALKDSLIILTFIEDTTGKLVRRTFVSEKQGFYIGGQISGIREYIKKWKSVAKKGIDRNTNKKC